MKVVWSTVAKENIDALKSCLLENFGEKATIEFLTKLLSAVEIISQYPEIGKRIGKNKRAFVVVRQISVYYRIEEHIEIIMLWDNRQMPN